MLLNIIILCALISVVYAWISLAPWVPTKKHDLHRVNHIAKLQPGQKFFEMGCGNGRVCTYIAQKNPKVDVVGVELAFFFYLYTKVRTWLSGPKNLKIRFGNALKYDISDVDLVYVFGMTDTVNNQIKTKIIKEMKPGARLMSYCFLMKSWEGKSEIHKEDPKKFSINVYQK